MSDLIPEGWDFDFLPAFIEINPSFDKTLKLTDNTDVSFIKMEDVSNGAVVKNLRKRKYSEVKKGFTKFINHDVLVAKITPCFENGKGGHVKNLTNGIGFGSTEFHIFSAKENSDSSYFYHFSNYPTFRLQAEASMCGTGGQRRVQTDFFRTFKTTYPPLPEQQKIAAILSSVDEVIEKTQAQINKLKDLKTGMMQELLSPREGQAATINNPQGESKNSLHHTEFKDSPLGRIPVGWEVKYFSEVIINLNQGVNTTTEKVTYSKSGVPAIRSNNVKENRLDMSNKKFVSLDIFNQLSNKVKPNANDILYCNIGSDLGAASVVTTNENFLITWNILRITANIDIVLPKFFSYLLNSNRKELRKVATESTMPFISSKVLSKFQFIIPPVDAQIPLVKILESVDKKIYVAESKLKSLKNSKKALMQDLLTGKVRVTAPSHPCDHGISASMHVTVDAS